ncbi:MAG: ABC transporter ATP-binding protein [Firmicutes bacterium]|nr:ABC transporter ATP-binding protein [Bacillota bacterium]
MDKALELENLSKTYKIGWRMLKRRAVVDVSLSVPSGKVFGLLGPNGAGKTTTIKMALGFLRPDSGQVRIFGEPMSAKARERIGFLPEQPYFYPHLSAEAALHFYAKLFGIRKTERAERVGSLLETVGLADAAKLPLSKFSKGMLQRFGIAQALINNPDLLIVDEPASGLDPIGQVEMRRLLLALNAEGKSILLSSHYLSEVENICHEVAIMNKGTVIARGKIEDLLNEENMYTVTAYTLPKTWRTAKSVIRAGGRKGAQSFMVKEDELDGLIDSIRLAGGHIKDVRRVTKTLEQLFVELIGGIPNED